MTILTLREACEYAIPILEQSEDGRAIASQMKKRLAEDQRFTTPLPAPFEGMDIEPETNKYDLGTEKFHLACVVIAKHT